MKVKHVFVALVAALVIGSIAFSSINKEEAHSVRAEAYSAKTSVQNGLFVKITDENNIVTGEDLLLVGENTQTIQHLVGASYHYWVTTENGGAKSSFNNRNYVYCEDSKVEMATSVIPDSGEGTGDESGMIDPA